MATAPWTTQRFRFLIADEISVLGVAATGELLRFDHWDTVEAAPRATAGQQIGEGWADFRDIFAGGNGVIYAITPDGRLLWYRYTLDPSGGVHWDENSSQQIGFGWHAFPWVFSGGGGLIYAVTPDGNVLYYRDVFGNGANAPDGSTGWGPNSGTAIGFGWSGFRHVLSGGDGVIYAVTGDGRLLWYGDELRDGTNGPQATQGWASASGSAIGSGWDFFTHVFAGWPGQIFGCQTANWGGRLIQYRDQARNGTADWITIGDLAVQTDIDGNAFSCGWQIAKIEGYAWPLSGGPGDTFGIYASAMHDGLASLEVVRLTGQGPELGTTLAQPIQNSFQVAFQPDNGFDQDCGWPVVVSMSVDGMELPDNGFYSARLRGPSGPFYDVPFVIRRGSVGGNIALIVNTNTWNAYNSWGGASNYSETASPINLTLKRPNHHLLTASTDHPKGSHMLRSEIWLADWLQSNAYAVDFYTDLDLHNGVDFNGYRCLILNTHPEYWTMPMMDAVRGFLDQGGSLLYLGGNGAYRPTSLGPSQNGGETALMTSESSVWATPDFPTYLGKPLFCARVDALGGPGQGNGVVLNPGVGFVPADAPPGVVGASGWNASPLPGSEPWGASGWETDDWAPPLPADVTEMGRDATGDGAVVAMYRTPAGGFVMGVGSLTFVGAMMMDATLQALVTNALAEALK